MACNLRIIIIISIQSGESNKLSTFKQYRIHSQAWFDYFINNVKNNSHSCLNNHKISCLIGVLTKSLQISPKSMNLFAAICGIVGSACYLAFFIGGRRDSDGQGTNMPWILVCAIRESLNALEGGIVIDL